MSKAVKLKNNLYLDSRSIVHNKTILKTFLDNLNTIVASGSNSNGTWLRFKDDTTIAYGIRSFSNVHNDDAQVGGLWYTSAIELGKLPCKFASRPIIMLTGNKGSMNAYELNVSNSGEDIGYCWFANGTKRTGVYVEMGYIAIGKWGGG